MRTSAKIITALSVTGLAVVAGSAFTGAGLTAKAGVTDAQFLGGTVAQNVVGAELAGIGYKVEGQDTLSTKVTGAELTFTSNIVYGSDVSVAFNDGTSNPCDPVLDAGAPEGTETTRYDCTVTGLESVRKTAITVTAKKNIAS